MFECAAGRRTRSSTLGQGRIGVLHLGKRSLDRELVAVTLVPVQGAPSQLGATLDGPDDGVTELVGAGRADDEPVDPLLDSSVAAFSGPLTTTEGVPTEAASTITRP